MISRESFVNHKLENVKIFVYRALSVVDEYVRIANSDPEIFEELQKEFDGSGSDDSELEDFLFGEYERATDILLDYQEIVVQGALNQINAIVEFELKSHASNALSKHLSKPLEECRIKERGDACKAIKEIFGIGVESLPGYSEVEYVRKLINAYKHDDGYSKENYEPWFTGYIPKKYEVDPDEILKYVEAAEKFLSALPGEKPSWGDDEIRRFKKSKFRSKRS